LGHLSQYAISHTGQLSLAIPSWVSTVSTSHRAVTPCGRGVKAGIIIIIIINKVLFKVTLNKVIAGALYTVSG